jgi:hypothetical protein
MPTSKPQPHLSDSQLRRLLSTDRLSTYVSRCDGSFVSAIDLYRWNARASAAFWEPLGHLEVALRNTMSWRLDVRHERLGRLGSWLDDPDLELTPRMREFVAQARTRVKRKGKRGSQGQTISELGFGFWRYLVTKRLTHLWPDLAGGFPHAPDRRRETLEEPLIRLHDFRNRLAHHQRIWNHDLDARRGDLLTVAGYMDPALPAWIAARRLQRVLDARPVTARARRGGRLCSAGR